MNSQLTGEAWLSSRQRRWFFDVGFTSAILPLIGPAAIIGAGAFFAENGMNPIFIQKRSGNGERMLHILKLRTMPFNGDFSDSSNGFNDERATRVGRFLRKTTIDDMPQAVNILFGQMSVVGPRPLVTSEIEDTLDLLNPAEQREWKHSRTVAKPGWLSEFGNISRSLDPKSTEYLLARVGLDCAYPGKASLETDINIIRQALTSGLQP